MAICTNCGAEIQDGAKFCPSCGQTQAAEPAQAAAPAQQAYTPPVVPGAPAEVDIKDAQDNKMMAVLAYIIFFVPLLTGAHKTSPFVKFHVNQGTILAIAAFASGVLNIIPILGTIVAFVAGIAIFIFEIMGIISAAQGTMKPLPLVSKFTLIK
jgi:uncharacterized membrane protein